MIQRAVQCNTVEEDAYSARTMVTWLYKCGFEVRFWMVFAHEMD